MVLRGLISKDGVEAESWELKNLELVLTEKNPSFFSLSLPPFSFFLYSVTGFYYIIAIILCTVHTEYPCYLSVLYIIVCIY